MLSWWSHGHSPGGSEDVRSLVGLAKSRPEGPCRHSAPVCTETAELRGPRQVEVERPPAEEEKQQLGWMWVLPSLIKSLQLSERVLRKCGWQSECVHSLPLQTLRSADTDKSAISSTLPSRQRKRERNRGVVLSRREWVQTEGLCVTGFRTIQGGRTEL